MVCASVHIRALVYKHLHSPDMAGLGGQVQGRLLDCRKRTRGLAISAAAFPTTARALAYILGRAG